MKSVGSSLDKEKGKALLDFVVAIGIKAEVDEVDSLAGLAGRHVPMLAAAIYTKKLQCIATSARSIDAYETAKKVLVKFKSALKPNNLDQELAAAGDELEICKFLLALLNELRCTHPEAFGEDAVIYNRLDNECQRKLVDMFNYLDDPDSWDSFQSWAAILIEPYRPFYETPKTGRGRGVFSTNSLNHSPLSEAVSTPIARANLKLREQEKKIQELLDSLASKEVDCEDLEKTVCRLKEENKRLTAKVEAFSSKNSDYTKLQLENSHLTQQLYNTERELKEAKDSLVEKKEHLNMNEINITNLQRNYDLVQKEVQMLQTQLKEKGEIISRLRADLDSTDMELNTMKSKQISLENNALATKEAFEEKLRELNLTSELDREMAREKIVELEEALDVANGRAFELSAKLNAAERSYVEWKTEKLMPLLNSLRGVKSGLSTLGSDVITSMEDLKELPNEICQKLRMALEEQQTRRIMDSLVADANNYKSRCKTLEKELAGLFVLFEVAKKKIDEEPVKLRDMEIVTALKEENIKLKREVSALRMSSISEQTSSLRESEKDDIVAKKLEISAEEFLETGAPSTMRQTFCSHPLPPPDDEDDCLRSKSISDADFEVTTPAQTIGRKRLDRSSDESMSSIASGRYAELHMRNMKCQPHLRTVAYAEVINSVEIDENQFRNANGFEPPHRSGKKAIFQTFCFSYSL